MIGRPKPGRRHPFGHDSDKSALADVWPGLADVLERWPVVPRPGRTCIGLSTSAIHMRTSATEFGRCSDMHVQIGHRVRPVFGHVHVQFSHRVWPGVRTYAWAHRPQILAMYQTLIDQSLLHSSWWPHTPDFDAVNQELFPIHMHARVAPHGFILLPIASIRQHGEFL